jgi:uncharacterized LabA/DUF88 family protein
MEKVIILVDVQNIYYTTKHIHNCNFDYNKFWAEATSNREVIKAIAYAIDRGDEKQRQFQNILKAIGFEVKLKPFIQRTDGSAKGDWDVGITLDAMEYAKGSDVVVLAFGKLSVKCLISAFEREVLRAIRLCLIAQASQRYGLLLHADAGRFDRSSTSF